MSEHQIRRAMIDQFNLRIGANMTRYVQSRLSRRELQQVAVIGGDARTGVAIRQLIAIESLRSAIGASDTTAS